MGMPASGRWSEPQIRWHINRLELEAVFLALKEFQTQLERQHVLIRTDNTSVVSYINHPGRHSFQGFVRAGSDFTAMGGFSPSIHQSNAHPRSLESWGGHAFKEENSSRGMKVTPRVGSDDLEPLRGSGGGFIRYERECTLPVVLLPVPLPAGRGRAHSALADSQALCVSSDQILPLVLCNIREGCERLWYS